MDRVDETQMRTFTPLPSRLIVGRWFLSAI